MLFPVETAGEALSTGWGLSDPQIFSESMLAICPRPELCALTILSLETANPFHKPNHGSVDSEKGPLALGWKGADVYSNQEVNNLYIIYVPVRGVCVTDFNRNTVQI